MRFCLVSTQQNWGGGEELIFSVSSHLKRAGHTVSWVVREESQVAARVEQSDSRILHQTRYRGMNFSDWFAVRKMLRQWAPDVVIMNDTHAVPLAGSALWFQSRIRPLRLAYKHTVFPLRSKFKYQMLADKMICVSNAARRKLLEGGMPLDDTLVVYGGAEVPEPLPSAKETVRQEFGVGKDERLLVSVGNLLDCKGHTDLIAALAKLTEFDPVQLLIAGEGPERRQLEQQIAATQMKHRVQLLGYRSDANRLLNAADLVVHPSHLEGLSLVLIQAQMLSKPLVATAVGGAAEVLQDASTSTSSAWIAQPSDPDDLALKIGDALLTLDGQDERDILSMQLEKTAVRAKELFGLKKNSLQLADLAAGAMRDIAA